MAINKEITCQSCKRTHPTGMAMRHDEHLNLLCAYCSAIMFAVTEADERKLKSSYPYTAPLYLKKEPLPIRSDVLNFEREEENVAQTPPSHNDDPYDLNETKLDDEMPLRV